jgi:uncharacterized membrane protein YebE (DUF533 family)
MEFNMMEKLAVIKAVDELIRMDDAIEAGELDYMNQLAVALDFDSGQIVQAREVEAAEALAVIKVMPEDKKQFLLRTMTGAASSDGEVAEEEIHFIYRVFSAAGISSGS